MGPCPQHWLQCTLFPSLKNKCKYYKTAALKKISVNIMKQLWGCFKFSAILKLAMAKFLVDSTHYCTVMLKHWSSCALLRFKSVVEVPYRFRLQPFLSVHTLSKKIRIPITVYASHIRPSCPIFTHQPPFPFPPISQSMGRVFGGCQTSVFDPIGEKFHRLVNWN